MTDFSIRAGDRSPAFVATLKRQDGTTVDLTNASSAALRMRRYDSETLAVDGGVMTFLTPRTTGQVSYAWAAADTAVADIGNYWADVRIVWSDGTTQSFPTPDFLSVEIVPDLASFPVIASSDLALIRAYIGPETPPTDLELATLFASLGTVEKVAQRVLDGRLATMVSQPAKVTLDGDITVDNSANIKALGQVAARLHAGTTSGLTKGLLYRTDRER